MQGFAKVFKFIERACNGSGKALPIAALTKTFEKQDVESVRTLAVHIYHIYYTYITCIAAYVHISVRQNPQSSAIQRGRMHT